MNKRFLNIAKKLKPELSHETVTLPGGVKLNEGERTVFDFGDHFTGYLSVALSTVGSPQDAPAFLKFRFCEIGSEIDEDTSDYRGWISRSWLQEEWVHIDEMPTLLKLKRRYAFRYVIIEALGLSGKFSLVIDGLTLDATTSAPEKIEPVGNNETDRIIDRVALRTLRECMQTEFEDGPKRDRRLWLGDLRLQALANYETYRHNDLVKRCLYLFAGTAGKSGEISACVFTRPKVVPDDSFMFDYSLLFIPTLLDYYENTGDRATAEDLLPLALRQLELAEEQFDGDVVRDSDRLGWCFLDWSLELNKQCGAQAVFIYSAKCAARLCDLLGRDSSEIERDIERKTKAAIEEFYDESLGLFVSGKDKQVSYASNVWAALAGIFDEKENGKLLDRLKKHEGTVKPVTPYMYHHYIEALLGAGKTDEAYRTMREYWGGMTESGADTFYELFDPSDPDGSPYGNKAVNSYCHAWSCTPAYFLRKYFCE